MMGMEQRVDITFLVFVIPNVTFVVTIRLEIRNRNVVFLEIFLSLIISAITSTSNEGMISVLIGIDDSIVVDTYIFIKKSKIIIMFFDYSIKNTTFL